MSRKNSRKTQRSIHEHNLKQEKEERARREARREKKENKKKAVALAQELETVGIGQSAPKFTLGSAGSGTPVTRERKKAQSVDVDSGRERARGVGGVHGSGVTKTRKKDRRRLNKMAERLTNAERMVA